MLKTAMTDQRRNEVNEFIMVAITKRGKKCLWIKQQNMKEEPVKFPAKLEPWRAKFAATALPHVRITPLPEAEPPLWASKIGGWPYLPKGEAYPVNRAGEALFFLAQLNFGEMPALVGYPDRGLVQFFIGDGDVYGMGEEDWCDQDNFRVKYYAEVSTDAAALQEDFSFLPAFSDVPLAPGGSAGMQFSVGEGWMPELDYRFDRLFGEDFFGRFGSEEWNLAEAYEKLADASGHRVGGYAEFTQADPRDEGEEMVLLLQLDTDRRVGLCWGDMGVGNFFIRPDDLARLDFSRVMFYWDAY